MKKREKKVEERRKPKSGQRQREFHWCGTPFRVCGWLQYSCVCVWVCRSCSNLGKLAPVQLACRQTGRADFYVSWSAAVAVCLVMYKYMYSC